MISTRLGTTCYTIRKTKTSRSLGGILLQTLSHQLDLPRDLIQYSITSLVEFLEEIGVGTALHTEVMGRDMSALADFSTEDFVLNYGTHTFGGKHLFPTISDPLTDTYGDKNNDSQYLVAIDVNGVKTLFTKVSSKDGLNTYQRVNTMGIQNALYEGNLRGNNNKSLVHTHTGINQSRAIDGLSQMNPPVGKSVNAQVAKLMGAFEKAGCRGRVQVCYTP